MRQNISLLLLVLLTTATAGGDDQTDPADADKVIGMSMMTLKNPYFKTLADAAVAEAKKHGYRIIVLGAQVDVEMQSRQVSDFIERKVSAIILCPCHSTNIGQAIRESNLAGIPVFTVDIPCSAPNAKVVCHVATDNLLGGRQAAQAMIEALGVKGGKVAILDFKQAKACRLRTKGFFEEIGQHNARRKVGKIKIVAHLDGRGTRDTGMRHAEDAIRAHPDLRGIFAINDPSALGASVAVAAAGLKGKVSIIGFDGQPEGRQAIKRGSIYADAIQRPDRIGITTVQAVIKHLNKEKVPSEILVPTRLYRKRDTEMDPLFN